MNFCVLKKTKKIAFCTGFWAYGWKSSHGMYPHCSHNSYNIATPFLLAYQAISGANILYHRQHHLHATFLSTSLLLNTRLCNGPLHCIGYINQCLDIFEHLRAFSFGFSPMSLLYCCCIQLPVWLQILWKIRSFLSNIALPTCFATPGGLIFMAMISFGGCGMAGAQSRRA